jgi:glucose/arabinose dehydrogenase
MRRVALGLSVVFLVGAMPVMPNAAGAPAGSVPRLTLVPVAAVAQPTAMAARHGTRTLYVTEQHGVVRTIRGGQVSGDPAVDLSAVVSQDGGERGLLSIAFSPDGAWMYVNYTGTDGDTRIDQLKMRGRDALADSRRTILRIDQPQPNHNGGQLAFGSDGYLYIGTGDGGAEGDQGAGHARGGNGQSLATLLGKILRIAPSTAAGGAPYAVPTDNPFVAQAGARPEIWSYGLRNPWRFSFDRATGDLWIGDVGQDAYEEIDHVAATDGRNAGRGLNFGWNIREGDHDFRDGGASGLVEPVYEISHDTGACAVTGGFVYRGNGIPGLVGASLFSDTCDSTVRALVDDGKGGVAMHETGAFGSSISSFGESNGGALYVLSLSDGVFRVAAA